MRRVAVVLVAAVALVGATVTRATRTPEPILAQPIGSPFSVALSTSAVGARPVAVGLEFDAAYVCGVPQRVRVTLPAAEVVPPAIARRSVLVDGRPAARVSVSGHTVSVAASAAGGVTCHSIRVGREQVRFTAAARLGNPRAAGTYAVSVRHGTSTASASFSITG